MDFTAAARQALNEMEADARHVPMDGVALLMYADEEGHGRLEYKIVGRMTREMDKGEPANFFAIACSKAGEMLDTLHDSGSGIRAPIEGEFGYRGGVIEAAEGGWLIAAFSGGPSEMDLMVARSGINTLKRLLKQA